MLRRRASNARSETHGLLAGVHQVVAHVSDEYRPAHMMRVSPCREMVGRHRAPRTRRAAASVIAALIALDGLAGSLRLCGRTGALPVYGLFVRSAAAQPAPPTPPSPDASALSPYDGRPVREVRFEGLSRISDRYARNQLRTVGGQALDSGVVTQDIRRLYSLFEFETVEASVIQHDDGSVTLVYTLREAPIVQDVQVAGNRALSDDDLAAEVARVNLVAGVPVDRFRIDRARRAIEDLYRARGHNTTTVTVDEDELETGVILFRIREGERVRLMEIRFEGARAFVEDVLRRNVATNTASLLTKGGLDEQSLDNDVTSLIRFYTSQGYLDARIDRRLDFSPDGQEAIATFLVDEGPQYRLREVRVERIDGVAEPPIYSAEQAIGLIPTKPGDAYANNAGVTAADAVTQAYNRLGYVDANVQRLELRDPEKPFVDLVLQVREGRRFRVGEVIVQGNTVSKQKLIRRELRLWPDRPLDVQAIPESTRRLQQTRYFTNPSPQQPAGGAKITLQPEDPAEPGYRDVLVEVEDANTGSVTFLAAVSADSGLIGQISIAERNFDIANLPQRPGELFSRQRFRGAGQTFSITVAPGTEVQNFGIDFSEPSLLESDVSLGVGGSFRNRFFDDYDEQRLRGTFSLGRRFGQRWTARTGFRTDTVELDDLDDDAPVDAFAVKDSNTIYGVSFGLTRTTVPGSQRLFPTTGSRTELSIEQLFGDFTFSKLNAEYQFFLPVSQDALGRTSVLSFRFNANLIPQKNEAPIYERFFLGGTNFRGFDFRGVSPRGIANNTGELGDNPSGGRWSFFAGVEYTQPVWQDVISAVVFLDTGTVTDEIGFSDYRASIGIGLRIRVPALGPVPLAFDLATPIKDEDGDETRIFSFTADLPF